MTTLTAKRMVVAAALVGASVHVTSMAGEVDALARETCGVIDSVIDDFAVPRPAEEVRVGRVGTGLGYRCANAYFSAGDTECFVTRGVIGSGNHPWEWRLVFRWLHADRAEAMRLKQGMEADIEACRSLRLDTEGILKGDDSYYPVERKRSPPASRHATVMVDDVHEVSRGFLVILTVSGEAPDR